MPAFHRLDPRSAGRGRFMHLLVTAPARCCPRLLYIPLPSDPSTGRGAEAQTVWAQLRVTPLPENVDAKVYAPSV